MTDKEDKPDLERFKDRDTTRDEFSMGPTEEQIRRAEDMLGSFNASAFVEKRDLSSDYRAGSIQPADRSADPVKVLVSTTPISGREHHVVLSQQDLPAMRAAEITTRRLDRLHTMTGSLEPSHRGRRAEDKQNGTLLVSFFYPTG